MGIVRKQSIYSFIFIFVGFTIGAANTLLLYAKYLSTEQYGLTGVFRDFFTLFSVLATFGSITALFKFFPLYHARLGREKNDLPLLALATSMLGCVCLVIGCVVFKDLIIRKFGTNSPLFVQYFYLVIPLTISAVLMNLFEGFAYMLKRTILSNIIKEIGFRLVQTGLIFLYIFDLITIDTFFILFAFMYVPSIIAMAILVTYKKGVKFNFSISSLTRRIYKKVISFSLFHFSGVVISVLPLTLNGILIAGISDKGLHDVGIYTIASFMVTILEVPLRGMRGMGVSTYSEAFLHNDLVRVERMLKNASLSLLVIGICLFGLIYPNIENIVYFSKGEDFHPVINIFLIAGSAKLLELSMGMNDNLLGLSQYWKTDFFISSFVVLISIPVNIFFIRKDPLLGAACGQAIMMFLFCLIRSLAVWWYFKIQPFTAKTPVVLLIGGIALLIALWIPKFSNIFADIFVRGITFALCYSIPILYFNVSKEINDLFQLAKRRVLRR